MRKNRKCPKLCDSFVLLASLKSPTVSGNNYLEMDNDFFFHNADLLIPVLVKGDEVADISVTNIGLLG